jgi:D-aminoacyl-tRNA deacylase
MRAVLQRVTRASVRVGGETVGEIGPGLVVLLGVARDDEERDARYLVEKVLTLRVFEDAEGRMNLSLEETGGALLAVSQFTLYGDVRKGRRPSWFDAAPPERARPLYEHFVAEARARGARVETGSFQAMMEVELVNDGPVTILLDSRKLF